MLDQASRPSRNRIRNCMNPQAGEYPPNARKKQLGTDSITMGWFLKCKRRSRTDGYGRARRQIPVHPACYRHFPIKMLQDTTAIGSGRPKTYPANRRGAKRTRGRDSPWLIDRSMARQVGEQRIPAYRQVRSGAYRDLLLHFYSRCTTLRTESPASVLQ